MSTNSLILISEVDCAGASTATLTGVDTTYDVYICKWNNIRPSSDNKNIGFQFTKSGSADATANYDNKMQFHRTDTTFTGTATTDGTSVTITASAGNDAGFSSNGIMHLFNLPTTQYSYGTIQNVYMNLNTMLGGYHGSFVHTVASATDGIKFTAESGDNWASGKIRLYGLKK